MGFSAGHEPKEIVRVTYHNHKGEVKVYRVMPHSIHFGSTSNYQAPQWLMDLTDVDRNVFRTFALNKIIKWEADLGHTV